jgi:hypothetical protein
MKITRFPVETSAIPIEDAVGGIAVLLHLNDHQPLANSMQSATRNEDALTGVSPLNVKRLF